HMSASSSTDIPQPIDSIDIFSECVKGLNELCTYYSDGTTAPGIFGTRALSQSKRFGARYLLVEYLRILFHELTTAERISFSEDFKSKALDAVNQSITLLNEPFFHRLKIDKFMNAAK